MYLYSLFVCLFVCLSVCLAAFPGGLHKMITQKDNGERQLCSFCPGSYFGESI